MLSTPTIASSTELERIAGLEVRFHSSLHAVMIFLIATFGGYLQFQYQSRKKSLLEEHRQIMVAIYFNLFMYGVGLIAEFKLKTHRSRCLSIVKRITPLLGSLVVVLITILLSAVLGLVAFVIWALVTLEAVGFFAFVAWTLVTSEAVINLFEEILQWLRRIFIRAREIVTSYFIRAENRFPGIQENGSAPMEANDLLEENESPA